MDGVSAGTRRDKDGGTSSWQVDEAMGRESDADISRDGTVFMSANGLNRHEMAFHAIDAPSFRECWVLGEALKICVQPIME